MKANELGVINVRAMLREAYLAGFNASGQRRNADTMNSINQPSIGEMKTEAREYALARVPQLPGKKKKR